MKKFIALCLFSVGAAALTAAPASPVPQKASGKTAVKQKAPAPAKPAPQAAKSVPEKPAVPEQKQPFELWMIAQDKAHKCIENKQYDEALKFFDEAEKVANRGSWKNYTLYDKAELLVKLNRTSEAVDLLRKKVSRDRNTVYHQARVALMIGKIHLATGKYDEAAGELNRAISFNLKNWITADATIALGNICEIKKDFAGASKYYTSILKDETLLPGIRSRGLEAEVRMIQKNNQFLQALTYLDANSNIPQLPVDRIIDLAFLRSDLQIVLKDFNGARATLWSAMALSQKPAPWNAAILTRLAKLAFMQKRYQEAQNFMRRAKSVRGHAWGYDKEFHKEIDQLINRMNRERALRERKARQERERRARLEKQRKAQQERQRKAQLEKQRKAKKTTEKK